jgi:hypothetical protein
MADTHSTHAAAENPAVHHETSDVSVRAIFAFGAALTVVAVAIHFIVWLLFMYFGAREAHRLVPEFPLAIGQENRLPPEPRLQTDPREDMRELRSGEDATLDSYAWVDKNGGVVRIPIADAMKLTVQRGLPARQANGDKSK